MNESLIFPEIYHPVLSPNQTERAIKFIKDYFQTQLSVALNLRRITAPLFVPSGLGINDDLNGVETPVRFQVKNSGDLQVEIVQSLAKWKRLMLAELGIASGEGIYTDMNAIRPDEVMDNLHSIYVDQWDWERVISSEERSLDFLQSAVKKIYRVIQQTEVYIYHHYPSLSPILPETITFVQAEELCQRFPSLTPKEREDRICREYGAVFIVGIGATLSDGKPHDGRAPDYDDWTTSNGAGIGLNGDILVWYPLLNRALELSSMGIRVDADGLRRQLEICGALDRSSLLFHQLLLKGTLPLSIGGGIGQSRLCLFYLRKAHIGEVQASIWPPDMVEECSRRGIHLF